MARRELGWEMLDKPVESHGRFKTHRGQLRLRWTDRKRQKETDRKRQGLSEVGEADQQEVNLLSHSSFNL